MLHRVGAVIDVCIVMGDEDEIEWDEMGCVKIRWVGPDDKEQRRGVGRGSWVVLAHGTISFNAPALTATRVATTVAKRKAEKSGRLGKRS